MIKQFVKEARRYFGDNLVAIVLYGSRVWGFAGKESDYDLFIFLGNQINKNKIIKHFKKFKKINFAYIPTFPELKKKITNGSWASYITLLKVSRVLYKTKSYEKILSWLKKHKISKKQIKEKYLKRKQRDIRKTKILYGWKATKYITLSIGNRLQILTYFRFNLVEPNYLKNLNKNKSLLTRQEYELAEKLYKKMMLRRGIGRDKKEAIKLFKKVHALCKKH